MNALNCENNIFVYPIISQAYKSKSKLWLYIEQLYKHDGTTNIKLIPYKKPSAKKVTPLKHINIKSIQITKEAPLNFINIKRSQIMWLAPLLTLQALKEVR